jgi:hypothetical protein
MSGRRASPCLEIGVDLVWLVAGWWATYHHRYSHVFSNAGAFAALKLGGTVVTWGNATTGGDSSAVAAELVDVVAIYANDFAFAARTSTVRVLLPALGGRSATFFQPMPTPLV